MYPKTKSLRYFVWPIAGFVLLLSGCGDGEDHDHASHGDTVASAEHAHDDPAETCFICDASKRDKGRLWCREHARYEDRCWLCHPELEDKDRLWCKEHSLYEDECHLCHPELAEEDTTAQSVKPNSQGVEAKAISPELFCNEHGVAEIECGICQPDLASALKPGENLKIRFPSALSAEKAGIQTSRPAIAEFAPVITAYCETQYNLNAMAKVTPLVGGVIRRVLRDVGDQVAAGDALVELHSAEVASAKSAYLSAIVEQDIRRQAFERETRLQEQSISAEKDLREAEAAFRSAKLAASNLRQRLINLGLSDEEIERVEQDQDTSALLVIRAPFEGSLVSRGSVVGEAVEVGHALFTLADLSSSWLQLSIPADSISQIRLGQTVEATFAELPGTTITGRITWIDTSIDPKTRMVRARAVATPSGNRITTGLFGTVRIALGEKQSGAIVPRGAVQRHEGNDFVFVRNEADLFALRRVALGGSQAEHVQVLAGLGPDDSVVNDGSFIVMSEFLKSRLGAGCADH